jgi:hypothetical protein
MSFIYKALLGCGHQLRTARGMTPKPSRPQGGIETPKHAPPRTPWQTPTSRYQTVTARTGREKYHDERHRFPLLMTEFRTIYIGETPRFHAEGHPQTDPRQNNETLCRGARIALSAQCETVFETTPKR